MFNPGGFVLKLLFSAGMPILMLSNLEEFGWEYIKENILSVFLMFVLFYFIASVFGFAVRATGNYLVGLIVFVILLVLFVYGEMKLTEYVRTVGQWAEMLSVFLVMFIFVWPLISDVRKAIRYFRGIE